MLTDNRADYRTEDWFLIACGGDLVLKLAQDLMIGEDERGQTVLSPAREDALLRISSDHGCLTLQALAMDWTFSEDGGLSLQHLTFVEGLTLKLSFPGSSLILTPDFQAGARARIDREIRLMPTDSPTLTLTRVDEPVTLIEQALLPAPEPDLSERLAPADLVIEEAAEQAKAADALSRWDHQIPDEVPEAHPLALAANPADPVETPNTAAAEADIATTAAFEELPPVATLSPRPTMKARRHRPLAGLVAAAALLAPTYLYLIDGQTLGVDFPLTNYLPLTEQGIETSQSTETLARRSSARTAAQPSSPATLPAPEEPATFRDIRPLPANSEQEQLLIASLLAEAKAFYDAGLIVTPVQANTVSHLTQVLNMDPGNEEGLRLMYLSAVTLIEEAEAAHAAGDNFLARNLVEDVLGFHPEFDDARALLDSWARTPEG